MGLTGFFGRGCINKSRLCNRYLNNARLSNNLYDKITFVCVDQIISLLCFNVIAKKLLLLV